MTLMQSAPSAPCPSQQPDAGIRSRAQLSPDRIVEIGYAFRAAKTLLSAVELGVFTALAQGPCDLDKLKAKQLKQLHLKGPAKKYYEDYLVPLCAGGCPTDPRNLWPQRVEGDWNYKVKDQLETAVCKALCSGDVTLEQARSTFFESDWTKAFLKFYHVE